MDDRRIDSVSIKEVDARKIVLSERIENDIKQTLIKCPYCGKERWVTSDSLRKQNDTLCLSCAQKRITLMYIDAELNCAYFYICFNGELKKVLVDYDVADIIFGSSCRAKGEEGYVAVLLSSNEELRLTDIIFNRKFENDGLVPDHINHNIWDNRRQNLVLVEQTLNQANKCIQKNNNSGFRGIHFDADYNGWRVQVRYHGRHIMSKRYKHFVDAYKCWYDVYHGCYQQYAYDVLQDATIDLRYAHIKKLDVENGAGIGCTLFVQGCNNACKGCHNPQTWSFTGGEKFTKDTFQSIIDFYIQFPQVKRFTLCGGEPLQNMQLTNFMAAEFKRLFPDHKLWVYTGLLYEDIKDDIKYKALLELIDILVDGRFIEEQKDLTLKWKGSSNQRVIDLKETYKQGEIVLYGE